MDAILKYKEIPLSEIPFEKLTSGLGVIAINGITGIITSTSVEFPCHTLPSHEKLYWIRIEWEDHKAVVIDNQQKYLTAVFLKLDTDFVKPEPVNEYSGLPLTQVPYDKIEIGMEILSYKKILGRVIDKISKDKAPNRENDNWLSIKWLNGNESTDLHFLFSNVTVK